MSRRVYLVTMESPVRPEHPVAEVYRSVSDANRAASQRSALAEVLCLSYTIRVYRLDLRWWEDTHPARMYVWKKTRRGGKRVSIVRSIYVDSGVPADMVWSRR